MKHHHQRQRDRGRRAARPCSRPPGGPASNPASLLPRLGSAPCGLLPPLRGGGRGHAAAADQLHPRGGRGHGRPHAHAAGAQGAARDRGAALANHPQDCLSCVRGGDCELADAGRRPRRAPAALRGRRQAAPAWTSAPRRSWRDPNKCVLCGRCVTVCHDVQGVGAIDFTGRGLQDPGRARLRRRPQRERVRLLRPVRPRVPDGRPRGARATWTRSSAALADPDAVVVAQVAPAVPATLLEGHSKSRGRPRHARARWRRRSSASASTPCSTRASPPT